MTATKIGLALILMIVLATGWARAPRKITPLPPPVPSTCPSDMLCL